MGAEQTTVGGHSGASGEDGTTFSGDGEGTSNSGRD